MSEPRLFTVRPFSKQPRQDHRDAFRVYLSANSLAYLKLRAGDLCALQLNDDPPKTAIAWTAVENIQNTVIQTSKTLQECYGFKLGDKVAVSRLDASLEDASLVQLEECTDPEKLAQLGPITDADRPHWEWGLEFPLSRCEVLSLGLVFEFDMKGQRRSFRVVHVASQAAVNVTIFRFNKESSTIKIGAAPAEEDVVKATALQVHPSGLGGMSNAIQRINETLVDFNAHTSSTFPSMPEFYRSTRGILIYGPKGVGKSSLLHRIQAAGWAKSFSIGSSALHRGVGDGEAKLRKVFQDARLSQPSVIIIDQIEFIAPKRTASSQESSSLSSVLCECIDGLENAKVLVVAATRRPNDVDDSLRTPHRLSIEVELSVPTAAGRAEILRAIRGNSVEPGDALIDFVAEKTHGYVGADLFALLQLACRKARVRQTMDLSFLEAKMSSLQTDDSKPETETEDSVPLVITEEDVIQAMQEVRPTAMREVFLETPKVRWTDIGGNDHIKRHLQKVVERPLKVSSKSLTPTKVHLLIIGCSIRSACSGSTLRAVKESCFTDHPAAQRL